MPMPPQFDCSTLECRRLLDGQCFMPDNEAIGHMRIWFSVESPRASEPFSFSIAKYIQFQLQVFEILADGLCYGRKWVKCGELSYFFLAN